MTIECHSCHARFRLDDRLFKGSKGMRVRCRKCGEAIVVMNTKAPLSPPRAEARFVPSPPRSKDPPPKFRADVARFSNSVPQTKAASQPQGQKTVTPAPPDPVRLDTAGSGPEKQRIGKPPGKTAAPSKKVPEPEGKLIDDRNVPSREAAPPEPGMVSRQPSVYSTRAEKTASRRKIHRPISKMPLYKWSPFFIAALLFLLLGGYVAYLGFTWHGEKLVHRPESSGSAGETEVPHHIIRDVFAYDVPRTASDKLFALKGMVENRGMTVVRGIRIRVTLYNVLSQVVARKTVPAGHVFTDEELNHMDRARIEEVLSSRFGEDPTNEGIPPGKSLPFVALFFDLQESIASYQMTVLGSQ